MLAPTFVSSGVSGKPTVQFSGGHVQVVSGSGSTSGTLNGEGNLIIGYAENSSGFPQTGSNDLIIGAGNGWSSYGELVGGSFDKATAPYSAAVGLQNITSGADSLAPVTRTPLRARSPRRSGARAAWLWPSWVALRTRRPGASRQAAAGT